MSIISGISFKAARIPAALFLLTFLITACGGGGGSSTGSGGGATDSSAVNGVYSGIDMLRLSVPGVSPSTSNIPITITISGGTVSITDGMVSGSAPLASDGVNFIVPINLKVSSSGFICEGPIIHTGRVAGTNITGDLTGEIICRGGGTSFKMSSRGTFSATKTSTSKGMDVSGGGLSGAVKSVL